MRRITYLFSILCVFAFSGLCLAQSLTDVATKEKKRRETNQSRGVKSFDLAGTPAAQPAQKSDVAGEDDEDGKSEDAEELIDDDIAAIRGYPTEIGSNDGWDAIYSKYLTRYREVANRIDQLRAEKRSICSNLEPASSGAPISTGDNTQQIVIVPTDQQNRCSTLPGELARLELEQKQIERDCAEDARRRGVLPGRARLAR